jgi:hypothetical protein
MLTGECLQTLVGHPDAVYSVALSHDGTQLVSRSEDRSVLVWNASVAPDVTYTPNPGYSGTDTFTFKANDGTADSNIGTLAINVIPASNSPIAIALVNGEESVVVEQETAVGTEATLDGSWSFDPDGGGTEGHWDGPHAVGLAGTGSSCSVSGDGLTMYYSVGLGGDQAIAWATRVDMSADWVHQGVIGELNSPSWDQHPSVSADEQVIVISRYTYTPGYGRTDL